MSVASGGDHIEEIASGPILDLNDPDVWIELQLPREVLYRILMFINPVVGHSVERVHALAALYDEITVPAALSMLAIWQAAQRPSGAKHRPLMWDDETRHRARPGTAAQLRGPAVPRAGERRNAS